MRALTLALSIAGLSLPALLVGMSGPGQAQGPTFKLELCNAYSRTILVSLVHRASPNDQKYIVEGWYGVESRKCASGDVPRGNFATFALSINGDKVEKIWGGQGNQANAVCVDLSKIEYSRELTENYECKEENGEVLVPFQVWRVTNQPSFKVTFP